MIKKASFLFLILFCIIVLVQCNTEETDGENPGNDPNILLIIADDFGKDACTGFEEGNIKPNTPNIDKIRNDGLSFTNFWVYPTCSPTRASIITGKYGYRSGVIQVGDELSTSETILQKYIKDNTGEKYATAIVGKWHLSGNGSSTNPEIFGMDYFAGILGGGVPDYYNWQLYNDGSSGLQSQYITEAFTDLAIDWVGSQTKPWFLWLAYNAPHTPFHNPPSEMHNQGELVEYEEGLDPLPYYLAAIEAMDYQIGRLIDTMTEEEKDNTIILFIGDNGTPGQVAQNPYSATMSKGSLYQGGINVPFFVSGYGVSRNGLDESIVSGTDLFSTISELAGIQVNEIHDSKSFKSNLIEEREHREYQYSERNTGIDSWTISNGRFKLIQDADGNEEMYRVSIDPYEENNLLESNLSSLANDEKVSLEAELAEIRN